MTETMEAVEQAPTAAEHAAAMAGYIRGNA